MKGKYTPGPWIYIDFGMDKPENQLVYPTPSTKRPITEIYYWEDYHRGSDEEAKANARLIAAAPEMLEALEVMVSKARKQNWNDNYPEELEMAVNAIKKALGE